MSKADGLGAINLEMPARVPRTEYSADRHWKLLNHVLKNEINYEKEVSLQAEGSSQFRRAWNYDFVWNVLIHNQIYDGNYTRMGHANYEAGNVDFKNDVFQLYDEPEDALDFDPWALYGTRNHSDMVRDFNEDWKKQQEMSPDSVTTTGIYSTLMSGLIEVFGWDTMLTAAGVDLKGFGEVANRYTDWILQYFKALADCDAPIVKVHDDIVWTSGAFFHPDWYRKYIFPNHKRLFAPLLEAGKKIIFTSDGDFTEFIDDIAATGIHGFVMEPMTDMKQIAERYGKTHSFVGNADTRILLSGTKEEIQNEVKRCMDIGKKCPGFFMAVGNHIPANTPVENAMIYQEAYEKYGKR